MLDSKEVGSSVLHLLFSDAMLNLLKQVEVIIVFALSHETSMNFDRI